MGWLKKNPDPISDRARMLNAQIADLEHQIARLDARIEQSPPPPQIPAPVQPRLRSTALPHGATTSHPAALTETATTLPAPAEPVFEPVDRNRLALQQPETRDTPGHFNELGVRKYDVVALAQRMKNHLRGPATANPKLVSYLAAGSIQGLRPLRYEKRVARNRLIGLVAILLLLLIGIVSFFVRHQ